MFKYLRKKIVDDSLLGLHRNVSDSFSRVHKDITHIRSWITHLHEKNSLLENSHKEHVTLTRKDISNLNKWLEYFNKHNDELKKYIQTTFKNIDLLKVNNEELQKRVLEIEKNLGSAGSVRTKYEPKYEPEPRPVMSKFEKKLIEQARPNRKDYVMQQILNLVGKNKHSTKEIEEVIVGEKNLCGRTTFYSYLKEMKLKRMIDYAEINDKSILIEAKKR